MYYIAPDPIGKAHPDMMWGAHSALYCGAGWNALYKLLPQEMLIMYGGGQITTSHDRQGPIVDPEDPRHPILTISWGYNSTFDGSFHAVLDQKVGGDHPKGTRLLQILYDAYLEPFSLNRVAVICGEWDRVPNHHPEILRQTSKYIGQTASIIGSVRISMGTTVMEGVTIKADNNSVLIDEGVQILENTCIVTDLPSDVLAYTRDELLNPYHPAEMTEGMCVIYKNTVVESSCFLDSCIIGCFNRIGHNSKIMKGVTTASFAQVLPGSVVLPGTKIGEGELWGGAPARKLGKVSKMEFKRPYYASVLHRDSVAVAYSHWTRYGDQTVYRAVEEDRLEVLMLKHEDSLPASVRARIDHFIHGREPWLHMMTRVVQLWAPYKGDDKSNLINPPTPRSRSHMTHNSDHVDSDLNGYGLCFSQFFYDWKW